LTFSCFSPYFYYLIVGPGLFFLSIAWSGTTPCPPRYLSFLFSSFLVVAPAPPLWGGPSEFRLAFHFVIATLASPRKHLSSGSPLLSPRQQGRDSTWSFIYSAVFVWSSAQDSPPGTRTFLNFFQILSVSPNKIILSEEIVKLPFSFGPSRLCPLGFARSPIVFNF